MRAALDEAGYTLDGIVKSLDVKDVGSLDRVPADMVAGRLGDDPLDTLVKLLMLGDPVEPEHAERALRPLELEAWAEGGLIAAEEGQVRALMRVVPDEELMLASDWPGSAERPIPPDHVLGHNPTAALLDNITVRKPVDSALDIGTGCGVQALIATRHAEHVVATDLNPAAVNVARFNAVLNDVEIEALEGSLFEPVEGRTFDLIVANPPFVISPTDDFLFRDSPLGGEGIVRRLIKEAPAHLNEGGICQMLCNLAHIEGTDFTEHVASAFEGTGCESWVMAFDEIDPAVYASGWLRSVEHEPQAFKRALADWIAYYENEGITGLTWGIVTMRRPPSGPGWFKLSELEGRINDRCGDHLLRCFNGHELLQRIDDDELLEQRPKVSEETRLEQSFAPQADGWAAADGRLATANGLPTSGGVDPYVGNLLIRMNGEVTVHETLERSAEEAGVSFDELRPEGLKIVRRLLEGGYLDV